MIKPKIIKGNTFFRAATFDRDGIDEQARTVGLSFSSEDPVERYFGTEILDHSPGSVRLGRLAGTGAVLVDHNPSDHVGVVESISVGPDRMGRAVVRFGQSARAAEIFQDVIDGIRKSISVGYRVIKMVLETQSKDSPDIYRVMDWEPLEISFVSIPADTTVGVGRDRGDEYEIEIITPTENRTKTMEPKIEETKETRQTPVAVTTPEIDLDEIRATARRDELERISDITAIGGQMNHVDLARQFVENGKSIDAFRAALLEKMGDHAPLSPLPAHASDIGMNDSETRRFSFTRAIHAISNPNDKRAQELAAFEYEASRAVCDKTGNESGGIMVPMDVLRRDLTVGTATAGGHTISTDLLSGSFIDMLRNQTVVFQRTTQLTGLTGNVAIPRQTGGATAYWVAESGAPTESQQAFDQVPLSPKTVGAFTDFSRKLMLQSSLDVEAFVRADLARTLGLEIDRTCINGSGSGNEPTGILNTTGIGDVAGGANGLAPAWSHIVDLESDITTANADVNSMFYLTNALVRGKLKQTEKASSTAQFIWGDTDVNGYTPLTTNQVPSNLTKGTSNGVCSAIIFGNLADLLVGLWGGLDLTIDPYTSSTSGTIRVVALQDCDMAVRHAASFTAMKDALTA